MLQRRIGNRAVARLVQRTKTKKVNGRKVEYAESEEEAKRLCEAEAATHTLERWDADDWEMRDTDFSVADIAAHGRTFIVEIAQSPVYKDDPAGLEMAYNLIYSDFNQRQQKERREERGDRIDDDYTTLTTTGAIANNAILTAAVGLMKSRFVGGAVGNDNVTLGTAYPRAAVATAVNAWRGLNNWLPATLDYVDNLHGYPVGPKNEQVGDTLDRRGDQGNIIAKWGKAKINVHVNPSD